MMPRSETDSATMGRIWILQSGLLLALALIPLPTNCERLRGIVDRARCPELSRASHLGRSAGYYEELIDGHNASDPPGAESSCHRVAEPGGVVRFHEADVVHYLDEALLQFELKPMVRRTLFGQPFFTNAFGMHNHSIAIEKRRYRGHRNRPDQHPRTRWSHLRRVTALLIRSPHRRAAESIVAR